MFTQLEMAPADPILGLEEAFKKDPNPRKVNLGVGVYKDESGSTPIFEAVKKAEQIILAQEKTKNYLPINGSPEYAKAVQNLVLGADTPILSAGRATTVHTPGGTGGLRVAADFLKKVKPDAKVWISSPTWPNHPNIFRTAGLAVETYPYYDSAANRLGFETMLNAIQQIPNGDVLLLHGSCHNPTGSDPTPAQWAQIAEVVTARKLLPLIDFAYQGLGEGLRQDAAGVEILAAAAPELLIASSFSKNFGLYNERVGALTLVAENTTAASAALSHLKICVRVNYSNPPAHGANIVTTILQTPELQAAWQAEVATMCQRIQQMRRLFVQGLAAEGVQRDFSFIESQHGMFSYTGLNKEQVKTLREQYSIYMVETGGRINVAGMTPANIPVISKAIAAVCNPA